VGVRWGQDYPVEGGAGNFRNPKKGFWGGGGPPHIVRGGAPKI
jgi:hypothetical protein